MNQLALAVHGGAWAIPDDAVEACRAGVSRALARGWEMLAGGGSALDVCQAAIELLENDPVFDAGIGSHLNRDGRVQLDAILMDGSRLEAGAIAAVERIRNPIQVARLVLERSPHLLLVGPGAEQFAVEMGVSLCNPSELVVAREVELWFRRKHEADESAAASRARYFRGGTVGAVARDAAGRLAAGTSTGGPPCKYPGRVGDSPLIGCGCYADARAAVSATGDGEAIMKILMAKAAAERVAAGAAAQAAAEQALALLAEQGQAVGGLIVVDAAGRVGAAFTTPRMAHAFRTSDSSEPVVRL